MGLRRKGREYALQVLYLMDVSKTTVDQALRAVVAGSECEPSIAKFSTKLAKGTLDNLSAIDLLIQKTATNWDMGRMAALDRNILRMGAYELLFEKETPVSVVIDEAVEIAKSFSTPDSGKFVNGILDKIKNERG